MFEHESDKASDFAKCYLVERGASKYFLLCEKVAAFEKLNDVVFIIFIADYIVQVHSKSAKVQKMHNEEWNKKRKP